MTIVISAKGAGINVMAADTLTELSGVKLVRMSPVSRSKLIRFDNFAVGMAGNGPIKDVLEMMVYEPLGGTEDEDLIDWKSFEILNTVECYKFVEKFSEIFIERSDDESFQSVEFLICTPTKTFHTLADNISEVEDFWAVGSGAQYAIGKMDELYREGMSVTELKRVLSKSVKCACKYSSGCQEPIDFEIL